MPQGTVRSISDTQKIEQIQNAIRDMEKLTKETIAKKNAELEGYKSTIRDLEAELLSKNNLIDILKEAFENPNETEEDAAVFNRKQREVLDELERKLKEANELLQKQTTAATDAERQLRTRDVKLAELQGRVDILDDDVAGKNKQIELLNEIVRTAREELKEKDAQMHLLREELDERERELKSLKQQLRQAENEAKVAQGAAMRKSTYTRANDDDEDDAVQTAEAPSISAPPSSNAELNGTDFNHFHSVCLVMKLAAGSEGPINNITVDELYDEVVNKGIPPRSWPTFIQAKLVDGQRRTAADGGDKSIIDNVSEYFETLFEEEN